MKMIHYFKDYRFKSILGKYFLVLFVGLVLPVTLLNVYYSRKNREMIRQEMISGNESALEKAYNNVNVVLTSMKDVTYSIGQMDSLRYLTTLQSVKGSQENLKALMENASVLKAANRYIDSIYIYFQLSGEIVTQNGVFEKENFSDIEWLDTYRAQTGNKTILEVRRKDGSYPYLITLIYPVTNSGNAPIGAVVVNLNVEELGKYLGSGSYRNRNYAPMLLIFDETMGTLIYSDEYRLYEDEQEDLEQLSRLSGKQERYSEILDLWGKSYCVSGMHSGKDELWYLYLTNMEAYESKQQQSDRLQMVILGISVLLCAAIAFFLAVWVYRPIQKTVRLMEGMSLLTAWDKKQNIDEIKAIQYGILSAQKENQSLNEKIEERMVSLHNAQICALQTQINPHFMYNTLESIGNAAVFLTNQENEVSNMLFILGRLLYISLNGENYLVPLGEEMEHVKLYMKIMEFQVKGRIKIHLDIPKELIWERIVKLTLQPLIENAIEHGLASKRENGEIWVRCYKIGKEIYVSVTDNGVGMTPEKLNKLRTQIEEPIVIGTKHIGLRNVNQRLKLIFGNEYGLLIDHAKEGGMCVTIHFHEIAEERNRKT